MSKLGLAVAAGLALAVSGRLVAQSDAVPPDRLVTAVAMPDGSVELLVSVVDAGAGSVRSTLVSPASAGSAASTVGGACASSGASTPGAGSQGESTVAAGALAEVPMAQTFITAYMDVEHMSHTLWSEELPHETIAAHVARHAAAVAALCALFPPAAATAPVAQGPGLETGVQYLETTWTDKDGMSQHVVTVRKAGESATKWAERHAEGVSALMIAFPPKPQTACLGTERALRLAA